MNHGGPAVRLMPFQERFKTYYGHSVKIVWGTGKGRTITGLLLPPVKSCLPVAHKLYVQTRTRTHRIPMESIISIEALA